MMSISYQEAYEEACKVIGRITMEKHFADLQHAELVANQPSADGSHSDERQTQKPN